MLTSKWIVKNDRDYWFSSIINADKWQLSFRGINRIEYFISRKLAAFCTLIEILQSLITWNLIDIWTLRILQDMLRYSSHAIPLVKARNCKYFWFNAVFPTWKHFWPNRDLGKYNNKKLGRVNERDRRRTHRMVVGIPFLCKRTVVTVSWEERWIKIGIRPALVLTQRPLS